MKDTFLIIQEEYHFDDHGDDSLGKVTKFVSDNPKYHERIKPDTWYNEPLWMFETDDWTEEFESECICDPYDMYPSDGYGYKAYKYKLRRLMNDEIEEAYDIIEKYNNLNA